MYRTVFLLAYIISISYLLILLYIKKYYITKKNKVQERIYTQTFSFISNCFITILPILIQTTYLIAFFTTLTIMYLLNYFGSIYTKTQEAYNSYTNPFSNYTFIFVLVFMIVYMILSIYTTSPVYCMGTEEVLNTHVENNYTFIGLNNNVAAAWIAATGAVVATVTAPAAMKMKLLTGGSLGGLATLSICNQVAQPQNIKKMVETGFKEDTQNPLNMNFIQKSSIIPFDFDFFGMIKSFLSYFPSLKTILLERLPDECSDNFIMTYQTLFTQYNIMVLISLFTLFITVYLYTMIYLLNFVKMHKFYLLENYPNFLGKLANSRYIDYYITLLNLSLYLNFIVLGQCVYFMFVNYIPSNIGNITDIALQNSNM